MFSNPGRYSCLVLFLGSLTLCLEYTSPAAARMALKRTKGSKYNQRKDAEAETQKRKEAHRLEENELGVAKVFA